MGLLQDLKDHKEEVIRDIMHSHPDWTREGKEAIYLHVTRAAEPGCMEPGNEVEITKSEVASIEVLE